MTAFSPEPPLQHSAPPGLDAVLREVFFLRGESAEVRSDLARMLICHRYPKGNILFYHGDPGDTVYLVLQGRVKVSLMNEEGREVILAVIRPAGTFGLVEALDGGTHAGTAMTLTDCHLAKIDASTLAGWLARRPLLHQTLVVELAQMLRSAYDKVGEQALLSVKRRLLATLIEIARSEGRAVQGDEVVFLLPTHQELAERVGSTRVVISRMLKELLEEEESFTAQGRVIRVPMRALVMREEF